MNYECYVCSFFFSSRRRHTRCLSDWSSDVCSSDLDKNDKCNFAYLEKPQIQGEGGRLRIRARFTGRSALNMLGQCVGLGDAFTVVIAATPQYRDGNLILENVTAVGE